MDKQTRETLQNVGVAFSFAYAVIPQVRKFVNEKSQTYLGTSSDDSTDDTTNDTSTDDSTA